MKFELLNTHMYCYPGNKDNDIEKIISKIMATEYKDKITVIRGEDRKEIHIEINTMEELRGMGLLYDSKLIMSFDYEPPLIIIYDDYIE